MSEAAFDNQQINAVFRQFSAVDAATITQNTAAFANDVYDISTQSGERFFLKILKSQIPEMIAAEAAMQQQLKQAAIGTPEYLEVKPGEYVGHYDDIRFVISKYIPGVSPTEVTPLLIESFGETLARLHDTFTNVVVPQSDMQWLNPNRVMSDLAGYHGSAKTDLLHLLQTGGTIFKQHLPQAVIHGDLWLSNVFADQDRITTVFDLETAEYTVRIVDLARTFTSLSFNSSYVTDDIIDGLCLGYDMASMQPLTTVERANIKPAIAFVSAACATWHAIHGTRYLEPYITLGKQVVA